MDKVRARLDNIALKIDSDRKKIAEKLDAENATLRGEKVVGHVRQDVVKEIMLKYYGLENVEHRSGLPGFIEQGSTNLNEMRRVVKNASV